MTDSHCPDCGHLAACHGLWPIPTLLHPAPDAHMVCHACRTSNPRQECPSPERFAR